MIKIPKAGYWLYKTAPNIFKVGINPTIFKSEYHLTLVDHVYLDLRLKRKVIPEKTYIGLLMDNRYEAIHFYSPVKGEVLKLNHNLQFRYYYLKDFLDKSNWLFSIKVDS